LIFKYLFKDHQCIVQIQKSIVEAVIFMMINLIELKVEKKRFLDKNHPAGNELISRSLS
jgi:hypothetical protein